MIEPTQVPTAGVVRPLLSPLGDRWLHTHGVAACAAELAVIVPAGERELLVDAAWLHDVGYAPALVESGFHPLDGALFLSRQGYPKRLCALVAHHSGARFEAEERGLLDALGRFELEDSPVMDALVVADLTTGPQGQRLSYDQRIDEILRRYAPGTVVHRAISRARWVLAGHVKRVDERLTSGGAD